jgi:hypothetical protein
MPTRDLLAGRDFSKYRSTLPGITPAVPYCAAHSAVTTVTPPETAGREIGPDADAPTSNSVTRSHTPSNCNLSLLTFQSRRCWLGTVMCLEFRSHTSHSTASRRCWSLLWKWVATTSIERGLSLGGCELAIQKLNVVIKIRRHLNWGYIVFAEW